MKNKSIAFLIIGSVASWTILLLYNKIRSSGNDRKWHLPRNANADKVIRKIMHKAKKISV